MNKKDIRKNIVNSRDKIDFTKRVQADNKIYQRLIDSDIYRDDNIFVYISFRSEVDTKLLIIKMLRDGKNIFVPKISNNTNDMEAIRITSLNELEENRFGTLEPVTYNNAVDPKIIDVILIPGIAFDCEGTRIGFGKGYYDKYIKRARKDVKKVGLAYDLQIVDKINKDDHDESVDYIITEEKVIKVNKSIE